MSTLQERVKLALQLSGKSKTDLWKGCGVMSGTVTSWVKGPNQTISGKNLISAAKILGVNPNWLATGAGEMQSISDSQGAEVKTLTLSAAQSSNPAFHSLQVNLDWIKASLPKTSPEHLKVFFMPDNAMIPTLQRGDFLLIDSLVNSVDKNGVYLIKQKGITLLKRISINVNGSLTIKVDNPSHPQEIIADLKTNNIEVVGKAVAAWSEKILK